MTRGLTPAIPDELKATGQVTPASRSQVLWVILNQPELSNLELVCQDQESSTWAVKRWD
jgi:hypothetical protein